MKRSAIGFRRSARRSAILGLLVMLPVSGLFAQGVETETLRRKQEAQERAREMARGLITTILDLQLVQLEENGLQELPIYKDIRGMRSNIDGLIAAEMGKVIELLVQAQEAPGAERESRFKEARQMIREIVAKLSLERQNLLRRLKTAELAAQVKRIIELQSTVLGATLSIPAQPAAKKETSTLSTIQDQRDVKALFLQLVETLADVSAWGGPIATGASEGIRILKAARVGKEVDEAGRRLEGAEFEAAAKSQRAVISGLRLLLEKIEEVQGLLGADREAALEMVRDLIRREEKLRDATRSSDLDERAAERFAETQTAVRRDLGKLDAGVEGVPSALTLLEGARAAAYEAAGRLFESKKEEALVQEGKVLGNLAEIEEELENAADYDRASRTADEYAKLVEELGSVREDLGKVRERAGKVLPTAEAALDAAPGGAAEAAKGLEEIAKAVRISAASSSRLA